MEGIEGTGIVLNSCQTYNGDLKRVITGEGPAFYIAGIINLPVGPSEEVSTDFWYYYSVEGENEAQAMQSAIEDNPGTGGWFGLWH